MYFGPSFSQQERGAATYFKDQEFYMLHSSNWSNTVNRQSGEVGQLLLCIKSELIHDRLNELGLPCILVSLSRCRLCIFFYGISNSFSKQKLCNWARAVGDVRRFSQSFRKKVRLRDQAEQGLAR